MLYVIIVFNKVGGSEESQVTGCGSRRLVRSNRLPKIVDSTGDTDGILSGDDIDPLEGKYWVTFTRRNWFSGTHIHTRMYTRAHVRTPPSLFARNRHVRLWG